ncbi:ABC transporter substrate-binding protein [Intestinibacter sp.]
MKLKKTAAILLSAMLSLGVLSGCSNGGSGSSDGKKELVYGTGVYVTTGSLDPAETNCNGWFTLRYGPGETLFKVQDDGSIEPWLVDTYKNVDKNTWELIIKDGIKFSNGKEVTGEAVKASLERVLANKAIKAGKALSVDSIKADGQKLTIKTSKPNPALLNQLCDPDLVVLDVDSEDMKTKPIGTGPFVIESFDEKQCVVTKNENYWDGEVKLDKVTIDYIADNDTIASSLQSGDIDIAGGLSFVNLQNFKDNSNYKIDINSTTRSYMFYYNFENELLSDKNIRKAIDMCIDKDSYVKNLLQGSGEVARGPFPTSMDIGEYVKDNGYNVDEAKKLLKEAGCKDTDNDGILEKDGKKLSFDIITYSSRAELSDISTALQDALKEVGIEIKNINIYEAVEDQLASGDFDICAYSWTTAPIGDPYYFLGYNYPTGGDCNYGKYSNEEVDKLVDELSTEFDQDKRAQLANEIVQIGNDDVAFSYVAHLNKGYAMKSGVSGFYQTSSDYYELNKDTDIK